MIFGGNINLLLANLHHSLTPPDEKEFSELISRLP